MRDLLISKNDQLHMRYNKFKEAPYAKFINFSMEYYRK